MRLKWIERTDEPDYGHGVTEGEVEEVLLTAA